MWQFIFKFILSCQRSRASETKLPQTRRAGQFIAFLLTYPSFIVNTSISQWTWWNMSMHLTYGLSYHYSIILLYPNKKFFSLVFPKKTKSNFELYNDVLVGTYILNVCKLVILFHNFKSNIIWSFFSPTSNPI